MTNTFNLYWIAKDRQSDMLMGEFDSLDDARNARPGAEQEIINNGGDADGFWSIDKCNEDNETVATFDC